MLTIVDIISIELSCFADVMGVVKMRFFPNLLTLTKCTYCGYLLRIDKDIIVKEC